MPYPHPIRLRGPWDFAVGDQPWSDERVMLPDGWPALAAAHAGRRLRLRRWFNRPTNLEPHEQVWLVVETSAADVTATLNDRPVSLVRSGDTLEGPVTELLAERNELVMTVHTASGTDVRLEIREGAK
jgi:hypothetical protein